MDASRDNFPAPFALIQASPASNHWLAPDLEAKRLAVLHRYEILDTPPEKLYAIKLLAAPGFGRRAGVR